MNQNTTLSMKQLMDLISKYHLEEAVLETCNLDLDLDLDLGDNVVIIDIFLKSETTEKWAIYQYPKNWSELDDNVLEKSIRYHDSNEHLTYEEISKQGIVLFENIPWSRVQFVPRKVYDIYAEIFYEEEALYRC